MNTINQEFRFEELYKMVLSDEYYNKVRNTKYGKWIRAEWPSAYQEFYNCQSWTDIKDIAARPIQGNDQVISSNQFDMVADVQGSTVNMDAYLSGQPEDMFTFVSSESNIVKDLNLYISLPAKVTGKEIEKAAQRIYKYIAERPSNVYFNVNLHSSAREERTNLINNIKVVLSDSDSYMTNECLNILSTPLMYRYLILMSKPDKNKNGYPLPCPPEYINFMTFDLTTY